MTLYNREQLIGRWYRSDVDESGKQLTEYADFYPDGSFEFCFITQNRQGELLEQIVELGDWGLVGDIHFTFTKNELIDDKLYPADLNHPDNYQAYQVTELTADRLSYQHIISKESYTLKRMMDNEAYC